MRGHIFALCIIFTSLVAFNLEAKTKKNKVEHSQAEKICLEKDPTLKGKALNKCIKQNSSKK